jgi:mitotic spindle assembly checkpoint protein MAD2
MPPTKQSNAIRQSITLKGSTALVTEFFKYAVNTWVPSAARLASAQIEFSPLRRILFQRGVYPADDFHMVKKYGQTVLITQDLALENYLEKYLLFFHPRSP